MNNNNNDDLVGRRVNHLVVISREGRDKNRNSLWKCRCDCGKEILVRGFTLRSHDIFSRGCENKRCITHGESKTKLYHVWQGMKNRCSNSNYHQYYLYGGRGISVCDEWMDYIVFKEWALSHGYQLGLTLDRINTDGNYCPENCRWVTQKEQQNNKRTNRTIAYNGETHSLMEWCELLQLNYERVSSRLDYGWTFEDAISLPKNSCRAGEDT